MLVLKDMTPHMPAMMVIIKTDILFAILLFIVRLFLIRCILKAVLYNKQIEYTTRRYSSVFKLRIAPSAVNTGADKLLNNSLPNSNSRVIPSEQINTDAAIIPYSQYFLLLIQFLSSVEYQIISEVKMKKSKIPFES